MVPALCSRNVGALSLAFWRAGLFTWSFDSNSRYAATFFRCDAVVDRFLALGMTAGMALAKAITKYAKQISDLTPLGDAVRLSLATPLKFRLLGAWPDVCYFFSYSND
jgi:hypothetical protein